MKKIVLLFIFISLLCFGIYGMYGEVKEYRDGEEEYEELEQYAVKVDKKQEVASGSSDIVQVGEQTVTMMEEVLEINFDSLTKLNPDCIAWISIPGTNINYPVVTGIDNNYYVTHTFRKKNNKSGAIFLDMRNSSDFSDFNSILYGHNLKNSKMFSDLKKFLAESYFNRKREIILYMPDKEYHYEIFAVYKTMEDDDTYKIRFTEHTFEEHVKSISEKAMTLKTSEEKINKILTLSTCTNDLEGERIVVIGRLIETEM